MKTHAMLAPGLVIALALFGCGASEHAGNSLPASGNSTPDLASAPTTMTENMTPPAAPIRGKRVAPAEVPPVKIGKISYEVLHWGLVRDLPQNGGYLVAKDAHGKQLWLAQIYKIARDDKMEGDVQDIFITSLKVAADGKTLEMQDERGRKWRFDPQTRSVLP